MKYLRLFEYWLNEETQFNKSKPRETPILKTLQKDLYSDKPRRTHFNLRGILSRSLQKNKNKFDINSDTVAIVEKMELVSVEDAKIVVKDENGEYKVKMNAKKDAIIKALNWIGAEISGEDLSKSCMVTVVSEAANSNPLFVGNREDTISTEVGTLVFIPNKPKKPEDLAINLSAVIVAQNKAKIVTLGQLCVYASTKFTDFSVLEDKNSGTKEALEKGILKGEGGGETKTA